MTADPRPRRRRPARRVVPASLVLLAAAALALVGTLAWASGLGRGAGATALLPGLAFVGWNLVPFGGMAALVVLVARRFPRGLVCSTVGVLALVGLTAVLLQQFVSSESSTAALLFLFLPVYLGLVVVVSSALAVGLHALRARRASRRAS